MRRSIGFVVGLSLVVSTAAIAQDPAPAAPAEAAPAAPADPVAQADAEMQKRTLAGYEKAVTLYEAELQKKPNDEALMLKTATAINAVMRKKTHANLFTIDGTGDTPANKKIWKKLAPRSYELTSALLKKKPKDIDVALQHAEAFMYESSSYGIVTAILQGAASEYQENANRLIKLNEKADGAVGHVYLGAFFTVAPWPMSDGDKADKHFEKAVKLAPQSVRNQYHLGVSYYRNGNYKGAVTHLEKAVNQKCGLPTERDFCAHAKKLAKTALAAAKKKL